MPNMIELASSYQAIVDLIYKEDSRTAGVDTPVQRPDFTNTPEVKYLHISTQGFGDYDRNNGFSKSSTTTEWRTFRLTVERGLEVSVDRMDDEETLNMTFGTVIGNITREHMVPELDAYRFATYASTPGVFTESGVLTKDTVVNAIDEAVRAMNAKEVTQENRILFVNSDLQVALNQALQRSWGSEDTVNTVLNGYNNMRIVYVPPRRFFTGITLHPGASSWGYEATGDPINFMIVQPNAIVQAVKLMVPKIFDPDVNQDMDAWKYQFRLYHDCFIYENKLSGVYVHDKGSI